MKQELNMGIEKESPVEEGWVIWQVKLISYFSRSSISSVTQLLTYWDSYLISTDRNTDRNIHKFTSILEKALGREMVLPERKIRTLEELLDLTFKHALKNTTSRSNRCMTYQSINPLATDFPNLP